MLSPDRAGHIDQNTVDLQPNYDGRYEEPVILPSRLPNLLLNGSSGIAVGMATNIPPHNLGEIVDAVVMLIDNPNATLDDIIDEMRASRTSERQGRLIDSDESASLEKKKREGYF